MPRLEREAPVMLSFPIPYLLADKRGGYADHDRVMPAPRFDPTYSRKVQVCNPCKTLDSADD